MRGQEATLIILLDGVEQERIILSNYPTKESMHQLMMEKGFRSKPQTELARMRAERQRKDAEIEAKIQARRKAHFEKAATDRVVDRLIQKDSELSDDEDGDFAAVLARRAELHRTINALKEGTIRHDEL